MDNVRILFVLQNKHSDESEVSKIMADAFEACKQNNTDVQWIKEKDLNRSSLNKNDFVVFENFEGKVFEELNTSKCARILGPLVVSICLMEGKAIPNFPWPIYNVAMYDCVVTCSHLSKTVKAEVKEKVELMGGCYVDTLVEKNTHLVTGSAKSQKYLTAAEAGLKLMSVSWIEQVWKASQSDNIHADDEQFKKYRCLPFESLIICATGFQSSAEKKNLEQQVISNGGIYTGKLNLQTTDVLICYGEAGANSEKYKFARQHKNIKCVTLDWIKDSITKGYALCHTNYQIQKITSTPTKQDEHIDPEFSVLSAIAEPNMSQRQFVEDTITTPMSPVSRGSGKRKASVKDYGDLVEKLDIKKAKKAGQYLDGCSVYVTGFSNEHGEKINKIINLSGATRYDTYSERVTHVIVGDPAFHEVKIIKNKGYSSVMVTLQWLLDSIDNEHPVNEQNYLMSTSDLERSEFGSPLSKKGVNLLRSSRVVAKKDVKVNLNNISEDAENVPENDIIQQYMDPHNSSQEDTLAQLLKGNANFTEQFLQPPPNPKTNQFKSATSTQESTIMTQDETESDNFFQNLKFLVLGFEEGDFDSIKEKIEDFAGEVVSKSYKGVPDYAVVPIFNDKEVHHTAGEVVNSLFIFDCAKDQKLIEDILYFHRPFNLKSGTPLQNCVITLSSYGGFERIFLRNLIESLGGVAQEQFARVTSEAKGVVASTHLVSSEATGKKYEAALKWGLPAVSKDWLLECAKLGKYVEETSYLLNDKTVDASEVQLPSKTRQDTVVKEVTSTPPGPSKSGILTPVNQVPLYRRFLDSADKPFSQVTPVNKIMQNFRESYLNLNNSLDFSKEPKEYKIPPPWANIKTPETPLGACMTPNPSPGTRKQWEWWLRQLPDRLPQSSTSSTPISDIKKQLWDKVLKRSRIDQPNFNNSQTQSPDENFENNSQCLPTTPENQQLVSRLQQLEDMVNASGGGTKRQSTNFQTTIPAPAGSSDYKDSQPCTVGWDYQDQNEPRRQMKIFSLSGIGDDDTRTAMVQQIENLGGAVSDLTNYDPSCTHLLCPKPGRNEKSLSCMAAGKWVLHISYLDKSVEAGRFLNEEEFEFGNPRSIGNISVPRDTDTDLRMERMHWWRKEISKRGYGAFNDMRAIVVAQKREPIVRVIEAGGGTVIDVTPPFDDTVHATHCLLEQKSIQDFSLYIQLAKQGIFLVNTVYISDYLHQPNKDVIDCILPYFTKYYSRN